MLNEKSATAEVKPPLILVVDDDPMLRMLMRESLEQAEFSVVEAGDGQEAVDLFKELLPDAVLLDVEMPVMDGYAACNEIRNLASGKHTPIIMVTGREDTESVNQAYQAGATDFITKPINWAILGHRVRYILRGARLYKELHENKLREARLGRILDTSSNELLVFNADTLGIVEANKGAQNNLGYSLAELLTMNPIDLMAELDPVYFDSLISPLRSAAQNQIIFEVSLKRKNSTTYTAEVCLQLSRLETPAVFFAVVQDITERKRIEERIRHLAYYDKLTDLPNRGLFTEMLNQALRHAQRYSKRIATLFLDLDRFKHINDTLGHGVGDALLKEVAERLKPCLRTSDNLARFESENKLDIVSRFGGDEFLMLLTEVKQLEDAAVVAKRILVAFSTPFMCEGHELSITASIGISVFPDDGDNPEDLVKNADAAMYQAKTEGRNNYQFYSDSMNIKSLQKFTLEADLRKALERNEFVLHYQPLVDIKTGRIVGAEALIRWMHPERGMVSPLDFIPIAEETGLILPIGDWVMRTACAQQQAWVREGFSPLRVSVNLSFKQLRQNTIVDLINKLQANREADPNYIELELTESMLMQNAEVSIQLLNTIKGMGVSLAMDDFGTGYSSLSYLKRLPLDTLKIDRSFIMDVTDDPDSAAIVQAIIAMAKSLRLKVVAEGVETEAQLAFLRQYGCDIMQGYLFSRPVLPDAFAQLVKTNHASKI